MKKLACAGAGLAFLLVLALTTSSSGAQEKAQDKKPKYTISDVMLKMHKTGVWKKVAEGTGTADQKKELVAYYTALTENKPPMGDEKEWKTKTTKMLDLAKDIEKGDKDAGAKLLKEVNCAACHKMFKQ